MSASRRSRGIGAGALALAFAGAAAGCGAGSPSHNAADVTFLQDMLPHHQQAIAVAQVAVRDATDPRTQAFGRRVVAEQSPEVVRLQDMAAALHLHLDLVQGASMAVHRISPGQLVALSQLQGAAVDRRFLALSVTSEQGAVAMAEAELAHGRYAPARALATSIAGAPRGEIPQLQALLSALGGASSS